MVIFHTEMYPMFVFFCDLFVDKMSGIFLCAGVEDFFQDSLSNTHTYYHKKLSLLILAHTRLHTAIRQVTFLDPNFLLTKYRAFHTVLHDYKHL